MVETCFCVTRLAILTAPRLGLDATCLATRTRCMRWHRDGRNRNAFCLVLSLLFLDQSIRSFLGLMRPRKWQRLNEPIASSSGKVSEHTNCNKLVNELAEKIWATIGIEASTTPFPCLPDALGLSEDNLLKKLKNKYFSCNHTERLCKREDRKTSTFIPYHHHDKCPDVDGHRDIDSPLPLVLQDCVGILEAIGGPIKA